MARTSDLHCLIVLKGTLRRKDSKKTRALVKFVKKKLEKERRQGRHTSWAWAIQDADVSQAFMLKPLTTPLKPLTTM